MRPCSRSAAARKSGDLEGDTSSEEIRPIPEPVRWRPGGEVVARVQVLVAEILEEAGVERVGARAGRNVDDASVETCEVWI